jgi:hypothetical protein
MPVRSEIRLRLPNSPGALSRVLRTLADERVQVLALSLEASGQLRLIVDSHARAAAALQAAHHRTSEALVLVTAVPHAAGGAAPLLRQVADSGINVEYAYAAGSEGGATALLVMGVDDPVRAAHVTGL